MITRGRLFALAAGVALAGCTPYAWGRAPTRYDRDAFAHDQAVRDLGCVILGFSLDRESSLTTDQSLLLDVSIQNRCVRDEPLDLSGLSLHGYDESGASRSVSVYDPRHEIGAMRVDAQTEGTERLRIDVSGGLNATKTICIDLERVSPDAARLRQPRLCLYAPVPEPEGAAVEEESPP